MNDLFNTDSTCYSDNCDRDTDVDPICIFSWRTAAYVAEVCIVLWTSSQGECVK
jgi:hypothetical protein